MSTYVIVEELGDWPCHADYLLTARTYLQHGVPTTGGRPRIINLCRSLEHLGAGYYCSLLAQAREHRAACVIATHDEPLARASGLQVRRISCRRDADGGVTATLGEVC